MNLNSNNKTQNEGGYSREEKILRLLGLAKRAGRLIVGAEKVVDAARSGLISRREGIIVVAAGAAARTKKNIRLAAEEDGIEIVELAADMYEIGKEISGGLTAAVAVLDKNMASGILNIAGGKEK